MELYVVVVTGGHRNSLSLSDVRAVVTEGLRRCGGCSREWVSDLDSPLRDLARGRRDGRGDSSDLNLPIVAEVASSWSQLCFYGSLRLGVVAAGVVSTDRKSSSYPLLKTVIRNSEETAA
ncbi:unnamed protein product [Brassica napus]|uniref:(rape) hypothetical protein n=1 Tax=Brassica napus TaxID=3708 RepID=A0A816SPF0_BRANA|nr:unnamed protein product [Brassica napus]